MVLPQKQVCWGNGELKYRVDETKCADSSRRGRMDSGLKAWLDGVLIPAILLEYLAAAETMADKIMISSTEGFQ